ncbi:MAG TPA: membrane dipeptidase [Solirubrobacterales bacterium]|jgi:microsomal dipeptidase-like Zn-dependent dipeptidase|nr:membrane dipeptidase [Solirubrobacterales bacterium]
MLADLHAHYPMRVINDMDPGTAARLMRQPGGATLGDRVRSLVLRIANRIGNYPTWDGSYRITPELLREGGVGLALSVLFRPFEEMDLGKPYAAPPEPAYFAKLLADLEAVEAEVATHDRSQLRLVHNRAELDECIAAGATALVHAVEGGFHLGDSEAEVEANCAQLATRGVGYVTVAHLFFRQVATNANAVPFIPDPLYGIVFPQRGRDRLTPRGEALIRGLVRNRILIDLSHMDPPGIAETFALLDEIDPHSEVPVVSTHAGYRFGKQHYMHDEETLLQIKRRNGVVGLIMAQHQLNDGIRRKETTTLEEAMEVICKHVDKIAEVTGGYEQIALGSDFDGFVKPTPGGLETMADLKLLEAALRERYGDENAERMVWKNALGVLQRLWPASRSTPA